MNTPESARLLDSEVGSVDKEVKEGDFFTLESLRRELAQIRSAESELYDHYQGEEYESKVIDLRYSLVESLILQASRFQRVFKTSGGSLYFNLKSGHVFRAKWCVANKNPHFTNKESFVFSPIMDDIFFIDGATADKLAAQELRPGDELQIAEYQVGVHPLELNIDGFGSKIVYEVHGSSLRLLGSVDRLVRGGGEYSDLDQSQLVGGVHVGHSIVEKMK